MKDTKQYKIYTELDEIKTNYETGSSEKISGLYRSPFKIIKMCEYYSSSRYLKTYKDGEYNKDGMGRDKPFYNIVNFRVALAKTATDLDIKDIQIISDNPKHATEAMILNREAYEWMKPNFALTLNKMGATRPKFGGYLLKKTIDSGKLKIDVVDWTRVYTDLTDIMGGSIVEVHNMSPVALKAKDGIWEGVDDVLKAYSAIKPKEKPNKIEVLELLGELPEAFYKDFQNEAVTEKDKFTFSLQKYFIANIDGQKFALYAEKPTGELSDYYEYLSWEDNSLDLGRGVIEDCEEAQVWTNDAVVNEATAMALAGRVGIKTTSKKLGNNVLEHDHGKIYELGKGEDINSFNLAPSALGQYQNQIEKWRMQGDNVASSYNAVTGEQPTSGTPYSQTALLNQVATKPFDYKREEWGIHLTKIFDKWIIPYLIKKIKKEHILVSEFSDNELDMIDESFANFQTNEELKPKILDAQRVTQEEQLALTEGYKKHIKKDGKKRFLEVPEGYFDDIECKITILTTGEQKNKAVILQSISELMKTVISSFMPTTGEFAALKDPTLSKMFNLALELTNTGITPADIGKGAKPTKQVPQGMPTAQQPFVPSPMTQSAPLTPMQ